MLSDKVPKDVYERIQRQFSQEKRALEARLATLEIDYKEPLDFLDKCILISNMLLYLHKRFNFEQKKTLLKAIFKRIYVKNKAIVDVELSPPFSILLGDDIKRLFKNPPSRGTEEDIFEQFVRFSLSEEFSTIKECIGQVFLYSVFKDLKNVA